MFRIGTLLLLTALAGAGTNAALAQTVATPSTGGTLVIVPASGEVTLPNDQALATFMIEEQNKDKAAAASAVNRKMKQGTELIRQADPRAMLKTRGYYTYPVYADEQLRTPNAKARQVVGWRVGQYLEVTTASLDTLPKTVAAAQSVLALNGLQFGLADATRKKLDQQRIDAAYRNLMERVAAIAKAMGREAGDAVVDTVDFEASGAYAPADAAPKMMRAAMASEAAPVEEPSFEPGETTLSMRLVGKVKFK
ncbi:MAG: SIMPL domain-containing protein [Burkholderiaceae bacterium]